ncbi:IS66 family transposase [Desulfonema limicola]|nr:IS66 family transposase [Desulfonema limicola]
MNITKEDLAKMTLPYLKSLDHETLVDISFELRNVVIGLLERLEKNSKNSSNPPSSDNPYKKKPKDKEPESSDDEDKKDGEESHPEKPNDSPRPEPERNPGRQPGSQGFWRSETPVPEQIISHYPEQCPCCNRHLNIPDKASPYMGYYVFELEKTDSGIRISCCLHHYYIIMCECGQEVKSSPGQGYVSHQDGRKKDLKLTEYVMTGPMLVTFIAALSVRYRMSRPKIREFLMYWFGLELSVGTIDRCIREAGVACFPVVEELIDELQKEDVVHLDETPWNEKGVLKWMWVAVSCTIAIYLIGTRKKEELLKLITEAFLGWLVTDGYMAYRDHEKRQRCLAHLIRKAVALTGAVDEKAQKMGDWLLKELRCLIKTMAEYGEDNKKKCSPILARLKKACNLGAKEDHAKLKALANEILNDWDAVVAFVKNPDLPPTNNEAERALRHAVISKRISFGTRTSEGSKAYAALLSVIETCRLRNQNPWDFISQVISLGRKGIAPGSIPLFS